jgi:dihydrofolate synthase/folylpolyglutamate synthase
MINHPEHSKAGIEEALLAIPKFGKGVGLHRMRALCEPLADWMCDVDAIKVTGSNGKGSVSAMVSSILLELGYSTGLYTSPHLREFNERIMLDGRPISDQELAGAVDWFDQRRAAYQAQFPDDTVGAFEAFTAIALRCFSKALVIEAGIGGRYDSTRTIRGRVVALTSLDLEHTALLGNDLELIAYDKADLCPDGGILVTGVSDRDLLRRLEAYCALRNITLRAAAELTEVNSVALRETYMELNLALDGISLPNLRVKLAGFHQVTNLRVAVLLLQEWLKIHEPAIHGKQLEQAIRRGLQLLAWPGRFERIRQNPDVFIDVGHSPGAIRSLVQTVRTVLNGKRILLVTGVSYDKEVQSIVKELLTVADAVICTRAYHKGSPPEKILQIVRETRPDIPASLASTIEAAANQALEFAAREEMTVLIAGGLFLSIEAATALAGQDPQGLRFF